MEIKSTDIIVYSLNPDIYKHRSYYIDELRNTGFFKDVKRISFNYKLNDRVRTIITAHIYALLNAVDKNEFPLLLLEDDARLIDGTFPANMNLPDSCDLLYIGGSTYLCGQIPNLYITDFNKDYYRVCNMLSAHAILIPNKKGARIIIDAYVDAIFRGRFNDVTLGDISKNHVFLTPKDGMYFYQDDKNVQNITNFKWEKIKDKWLKK